MVQILSIAVRLFPELNVTVCAFQSGMWKVEKYQFKKLITLNTAYLLSYFNLILSTGYYLTLYIVLYIYIKTMNTKAF